MPKTVYVGKKSFYFGKTLWEIIGNLKDYGVGRLITRSVYVRYPEPSFDKIVRVETESHPLHSQDIRQRRVSAYVERVFRGHRNPQLIELLSSSYKTDFRLIPKDEEEIWYKRLKECKPKERIYDPYIPVPPLLNLLLKEEKKAKGERVEDVKVRISINEKRNNLARLAREGETPTHYMGINFGKAASPSLFENIEASRHLFENRDAWKDETDVIQKLMQDKSS